MTDIIKDFEHEISGEVRSYVRHNPEFLKKNIEFFKQELEDVGAEDPLLIALGNDAHDILTENLGDEFRIVKVTHYSHFISKEDIKSEFDELIASTDLP